MRWATGDSCSPPPRSYMGVYGITNPWAGWLISKAPELVAETSKFLQRPMPSPRCPRGEHAMVRLPGTWKCYRHEEAVVIEDRPSFSKAPVVDALGAVEGVSEW